MTTKLTDTFIRMISSQIELIKSDLLQGKNWFNIQLHEEEGEILITLFMSDREIKEALTDAIAHCLPNNNLVNISIVRRDLISFCLM